VAGLMGNDPQFPVTRTGGTSYLHTADITAHAERGPTSAGSDHLRSQPMEIKDKGPHGDGWPIPPARSSGCGSRLGTKASTSVNEAGAPVYHQLTTARLRPRPSTFYRDVFGMGRLTPCPTPTNSVTAQRSSTADALLGSDGRKQRDLPPGCAVELVLSFLGAEDVDKTVQLVKENAGNRDPRRGGHPVRPAGRGGGTPTGGGISNLSSLRSVTSGLLGTLAPCARVVQQFPGRGPPPGRRYRPR